MDDTTYPPPHLRPKLSPIPDDTTLLREALAESHRDLHVLLDYATPLLTEAEDPDVVLGQLIQGLLDTAAWDRLELTSVLGVALYELSLLSKGGGDGQ